MIQLIPAIDLIDGKCVRLTKGDYATQKIYNEDPVAVAREVEQHGFQRLHLVDLDGAKAGRVVNHGVLERIATATNLTIDFGGGIKTDDDLRIAAESGAQLFTLGSIAVKAPTKFLAWLDRYGSERIILGADVREGRISINGWKEDSADELLPFLQRYVADGVRNVLCTEISHDGMLSGPAIDLYKAVMAEFPTMHLIASGGVSSIDDLLALQTANIPAVVFGKALYEGRFTLEQLARTFH
ncbi:MAG: 1-(5-phosphoribosyl)-5-[(5-phosphoribosylamino)methylideneamino]imidazole-4-carboxamide isomerase [Bacteroidaceae bacterium]|nr:1-(5-phosphoribosyl)-5-[(5-phosphoribosylamino)methylideneamino]imidazole-4-carboxamide isomerase [Bacteroidaceae bacterium]